MRSRILVTMILGLVAVVATGPVRATQPGLELPAWADLVLHFVAPPEIGRPVELVAHVQVLRTDGGEATLTLELPPGLHLVSGERSVVLPMEAGLRLRHVVTVQVAAPLSSAAVSARLAAPLPRRALEAAVNRSTSDPGILAQRLALLAAQRSDAVVTAAVAFSSTRVEAAAGQGGVLWRRVVRGRDGAGLFIVRPVPRAASRPALLQRCELFERNEELVETRPALRAALAARPEARAAAQAAYGEDVYALGALAFAERSTDVDGIAELLRRVAGRPGILAESRAALLNLEAMALREAGRLDEALRRWAALAEDGSSGGLRAYAMYNAGEALRVAGREAEAREWFRSALDLRPGLTVARKRLA